MKYYLKNHDRPIGIETTLYIQKPETPAEVYSRLKLEGCSDEEADIVFGWEVLEFSTLKSVLKYVVTYMNKDCLIEFILNSWPLFIFEKHEVPE